jgi:signal transduction histidine kinase
MSKGMGLSNITSRISSLNGDLQIESGIGKGMKVVARINTKQDETTINNQRKRRWKKR